MAKKNARTPARKKSAPRRSAKEKVSKVLNQVKEPLSLLGTLKEEGMANAIQFLTMASAVAGEAKKNIRLDAFRPQVKELASSFGFVTRADFERLEARLEEIEQKLSEREYASLGDEE